ncbi:MAG TPA: 30S ribosomal protein S8e, partial [Candidatus Altiarchaeales archaeon]|nr:30S ribosomal protein S8e [Candidatus Altiarchaeales archaeon]
MVDMYHGKITKARKKRKYAMGREAVETTLGEENRKRVRTRGGGSKLKLVSARFANLVLKNKGVKCEIISLVENPSNKDFTRRSIITKGAILKVKTPEGK